MDSFLLLETGDYLLQETGDRLILETGQLDYPAWDRGNARRTYRTGHDARTWDQGQADRTFGR